MFFVPKLTSFSLCSHNIYTLPAINTKHGRYAINDNQQILDVDRFKHPIEARIPVLHVQVGELQTEKLSIEFLHTNQELYLS